MKSWIITKFKRSDKVFQKYLTKIHILHKNFGNIDYKCTVVQTETKKKKN